MRKTAPEWNPADYARHSTGQERWARELFRLLAPKPHERVLDIGCGDGRNTAELAGLTPEGAVVGVDRSPAMIQFAQQHFPPARFPNLSFLEADACALPFHSEFDAVFSNAVLHWVLDHQPVLAGIARSLRPGGRCVLQMGGTGNGADVIRAVDGCLRDARWQATPPADIPYGFHHPGDYRVWLETAGLMPDSVDLIEKDMVHPDLASFLGWLRTAWLPYTTRVPADLRDQFLQAVTESYAATNPPDAEGQVHVGMVRLQVLAHKLG
jgi:trans-aconitate 2-methyltransferase